MVNILAISKLKQTGWVNLTQMTIISTTVSKNSLEEQSSHHSQQKSPKCSTWIQSQKRQNDLCFFQGKPLNITVIQVYALISNTEEAEVEYFYGDLYDLREVTPKKDVLFITGDCKSRIQETRGVKGKFGLGVRNEVGQRITEFCQENTLVIANTVFQQHKRRLYTWTSPDGQYRNQTGYILCTKDGETLYSQ